MCPAHAQVSDLPARELVPGDIVELHTGDRVPADLRLLSMNTATLRAEQASLTGEAVAVQKVRHSACAASRNVQTPHVCHVTCFSRRKLSSGRGSWALCKEASTHSLGGGTMR